MSFLHETSPGQAGLGNHILGFLWPKQFEIFFSNSIQDRFSKTRQYRHYGSIVAAIVADLARTACSLDSVLGFVAGFSSSR